MVTDVCFKLILYLIRDICFKTLYVLDFTENTASNMETINLSMDSCMDEIDQILAESEDLDTTVTIDLTQQGGTKTPEKGELESEPPSDGFLETPRYDTPVPMSDDAIPKKIVSEAVESSLPTSNPNQEWDTTPDPQTSGSDEIVFLAEKKGCDQCSVQNTNLDQRHYFTHVRVAYINLKESLQATDFLHPNQIDSFTVHNLHHLRTDPIKTYRPHDTVPYTTEKRTHYFRAPKFLRSIRGIAETRFHRTYILHAAKSASGSRFSAHTVEITYTDLQNQRITLDWHSWEYAATNDNPTPRHEEIILRDDSSVWVDSVLTVWLVVRAIKNDVPKMILTPSEQTFMKIVRSRVSNEDDPIKIISSLLVAHGHLRKRDSSHLDVGRVSSPSAAQASDEPRPLLTLSENPTSGVNPSFNNLPSTSRDGLRKLPFTPEADSVAQAQMRAKLAENVLRRRNLHGEKQSPSCKKRLTFANMTPVMNVSNGALNVSTTSLENWQMQTATPTSIPCRSGTATTPEKRGNANLTPLNPIQGPLVTPRPDPKIEQVSGLGLLTVRCDTSTMPHLHEISQSTPLPDPKDIPLPPTQDDNESLMSGANNTIDSFAHVEHENFDRKKAKTLKRRKRQQRRRQKIRESLF